MALIFIPKVDSDKISKRKIVTASKIPHIEIIISEEGLQVGAYDIAECDKVVNNIFGLDAIGYYYEK
jgi:hypothetical protein